MSTDATNLTACSHIADAQRQPGCHVDEAYELRRARDYPISRWYLRPAAARLASVLAPTRVRPVQLTVGGLTAAAVATGVLLWRAEATPIAAALVLTYWFFDRADGLLARRQQTVSAWGAWLDGNVDELVDVGLHVATATVVAWQVAASWPWLLLIAFLAGKYLLVYGLTLEEEQKRGHSASLRDGTPSFGSSLRNTCSTAAAKQWHTPHQRVARAAPRKGADRRFLRLAYHLPGNADVRVHLLVVALATGYLAAELALVAAYYNLRWIVRYALVARRLGGMR